MNFLNFVPNHIIVSISSWISRIIMSFIQLYMIKILLDILGVNKYAVFSVISGIMGWFMLCDFGAGVSIQNYISEYRAKNLDYSVFLSVSLFSLFILSFLCVFILYFLSPFLSKFILGGFGFLNEKEICRIFFLSGTLFILTNISNTMYKIWYAEMKGYISNIIPTIAYVLSFIFFVIIKGRLENIKDNISIVLFVYFFPGIILSFIFTIKRINYIHIVKALEAGFAGFKEIISMLYKRGLKFWIFAVMAAIVLQIDYIVMAKFLKTKEIVEYNIASKVFMFGFFIYNSVLFSLWPVFAEKIASGDMEYVKLKINKYIIYGIIYMVFFVFCFLVFKNMIIKILAPNTNIEISFKFIILLGFYYFIRIWTDMYSMVLQSANILKPFYMLVPFQALISVLFQVLLSQYIGIYGIVLGLIISFVLTVSIGLWRYADRYLFNRRKYEV